ncbi:MAG: DUF5119 domain-containing protein [Rikenellaceae bacterium]
MKIKSLLASISLMLLLSTSCVRQQLEEVIYTKALIPVLIDWETKALMYVDNDPDQDLYSASVWLFPTAESRYQGDPLEYKLSDPECGYIEVPVGVYDVLIFNKTTGDYTSSVGFRGTDSFDTFEYYTNVSSKSSLFTSVVDDDFSAEPDLLAAWTFEDGGKLTVTYEEILYYEKIAAVKTLLTKADDPATKATAADFAEFPEELKQLLNVVPERVVHNVTIEERLHNLHSASVAQANLRGMSHSVLLASRKYSTTTMPYVVTFTNKYLDYYGSDCDMMSGSTNVIGLPSQSSSYSVETRFSLIDTYDGTTYWPLVPSTGYFYDVSDQVNNAEIGLDKALWITLYYCDGDPILPDLDPSNSGGFDVGVNDWDEPIIIPL